MIDFARKPEEIKPTSSNPIYYPSVYLNDIPSEIDEYEVGDEFTMTVKCKLSSMTKSEESKSCSIEILKGEIVSSKGFEDSKKEMGED